MPARPHLSPFTTTGDLVFLSGQLAFDAAGVVSGDIEHQTRTTLAHMADCLAEAGCGLADVVKTTVWLREAGDFARFNSVYAEIFGPLRPARSTVVAQLVLPDARVEIECIAVKPA